MSDAELVERAERGCQEAWRELKDRLFPRLVRRLGKQCRHQDAEDLAQETLLKVYSRIGTYKPCMPLWPWVLKIGRNVQKDRNRRRFAGKRYSGSPDWAYDDSADRVEGPTESVLDDERRTRVRTLTWEALATVPRPDQWIAMHLRHIPDALKNTLDSQAIADLLGKSRNAVEMLVHRAKVHVREYVERHAPDLDDYLV